MKVIWSIVGIVVLIIIITAIMDKNKVAPVAPVMPAPVNPKTNNTTTREIITTQPVIQPVIIVDGLINCSGDVYNNNLSALYDVYLQKRVIWQAAIANNTNAIQAHEDMDIAYNAWYQEARKCNRA